MKTLIFTFLFFVLMTMIQNTAWAQDEGPPLPVVEMFETHYLEFLEDGKLYQGIYMPESEYTFYTNLKIQYQFTKKSLDIMEKTSLGLEDLLSEHKKLELDIFKEINTVKNIVVKENWWQVNKFYIGVGIGAVVTGLIIAGVQAL